MFAFFERLIRPFPPQEPELPPQGLFPFCRHYTRGIEPHLAAMALLTGVIAILEVSLFDYLGRLVDWLTHTTPAEMFGAEGRFLWTALGVLIALPVAVLLHSLIIHQALLGNYPMIIRWKVHRYLLGQSLSFFQNDFAGRIATKVMQTALAVRETVLKLLDVILYVVVYFSGVLVIAAGSDLRLAIPLLIWVAIYILTLYYFIPRLAEVSARQADARSSMVGRVVDSYTNIATVKLFSHSRREADYAREGMEDFLLTVYPQMRLVTGLVMSVWLNNVLLILATGTMSIWLWTHGAVTAGAITAAVALVLRLNGMSQWIMWEMSALFENIGTVEDGMATIAKPREVVDRPRARPLAVTQGRIEFDHIRFHYGKGGGVIDDFSLTIEPGEKIGLVGRSGAGKSTLVHLLLRFHDIEAGRILIDGQDIAAVAQESLRAQIGLVTQDTSLLHRSVRDNILYGRPGATEADVAAAARQARAHDFIEHLQDARGRRGYDAHVGERGVKLSGGQRQRIAIARVLLKDAPILILDEATSALDSEVETAIQENLYRLMRDKTVIAIAHRLSTIAMMDRLIVLDQGCILEEGTHTELIARNGLYAQLWAHQSGGFLGADTG